MKAFFLYSSVVGGLILNASAEEGSSINGSHADTPTVNQEIDKGITETIEVNATGLIGYHNASANKSDTPVLETPVSVSVLTEQRLRDIGAFTLQDALGYVGGVFNGPFGVDSRGDWATIRGVDSTQYLDGLQLLHGFYNNVRPHPFTFSQVEVLKGPSSVLYGQGSTGGLINLVSKKPEAEPKGLVELQSGEFQRQQLALDFTGNIDSDASLNYRLIGVVRQSETQTDFVEDDVTLVAPALTWFINDDVDVTFMVNLQKNESGSTTQFLPHIGTIFESPFGEIDSNRFVGEAEYDRYDTEQDTYTVIINAALNNSWRLRSATRVNQGSAIYWSMWPDFPTPANMTRYQPDGRKVLRTFYISESASESLTSDTHIQSQITMGNTQHSITLGADYQQVETDNDFFFANGETLSTVLMLPGIELDLYSPNYGRFPLDTIQQTTGNDIRLTDNPTTSLSQLGFYLQDNVKINEQWILSLALRHDITTSEVIGESKLDNDATTGRIGLMALLNGGFSPYINYAQSFIPVESQTTIGLSAVNSRIEQATETEAFEPLEGEQTELGIKLQPEGTDHLITFSYYNIGQQNGFYPDPLLPTNVFQLDKISIKGLELEMQLAFKEFDVYIAGNLIDTRTQVPSALRAGQFESVSLDSVPEKMLSTFISYRPEVASGFKSGIGMRYVGKTDGGLGFDGTNYQPLVTDVYSLFDFMLGYTWGNWESLLNIQNVGDEKVITTCLSRGDCFYGARRNIVASIRYNF